MTYRTAALGALTFGALVAVTGMTGGPVDANSAASSVQVGSVVVARETGEAPDGVLGYVSGMALQATGGIASGTAAVTETGRQVAEGAYYLGGEFVESGRIIGLSTLQMFGIIGTEGAEDRARLGEQGVAGAWWGTSGSSDTAVRPAPAAPNAASAESQKRTGSGRVAISGGAPSSPGQAGSAGASMRPEGSSRSGIMPVSLSAEPKTGVAPAAASDDAAASEESAVGADICGWQPTGAGRTATLSGEEVSVLSKLGLMEESAQRLPDGTIFLPKVTQRLLDVRTAISCKGTVSTTHRLVGHVIANPSSSGLVQAEQDGRIEAGERGFPVLGQRVEKGELLGYLVPILSSKERAELQGEIALVRGKIAEHELMIARTRELPLLPFREGRILSMRVELSKLRAQRDALIEGLSVRQPLTASVPGVIARAQVRVGQVVEERQLLWEIADTDDLWVEADSFGSETSFAKTGSSAETQDGLVMDLTLEGMGLSTDGAQSSPIQFRVDSVPAGVRIGQQVIVNVRELGQVEGVMVPRSALVRRSNGEMTIWVVKGPEQYEPRKVKWTSAGSKVAIIDAGLEEGVRVVTAGATLLSEVR